ncbi:acetolactate synthase [Terrihabitans soli]|uniref:Acetolactate synthase n=1 Tax=Terrihabitans soli TaxID=708113 RepID=A0A6S6QXB8_9HYPH|nr:thiamine pyrophosphate-binding protein [Terrihabitans soli]BCJ92195.1 acetolactate synthase [Terrihabitans soli]
MDARTESSSAPSGLRKAKLYEHLAEAFRAEGVTRLFTLLGDANMHWAITLGELGVKLYHVRHEHCACAMATSYASATGDVGVASVTCGPGLTQLMTALPAAVRASIPLVVFAGESPIGAAWYNQYIDHAPFVRATGATYIAAHDPSQMFNLVRRAFLLARQTRQPVVIGVPFDLQQREIELPAYTNSLSVMPQGGAAQPDPDAIARAVALIQSSQKIVVLGGRGAKLSGARAECEALADACGAYLAATLPVRGMFNGSPYEIGIAGGFSADATRKAFSEADLVIAVGARLTYHTAENGKLFPQARVLQIDINPLGEQHGRTPADLYISADAGAGARALAHAVRSAGYKPSGWRTPELHKELISSPPNRNQFPPDGNAADPRDVIAKLDAVLPKTWHIVNSSGHCSYFSAHMHGRDMSRFHTIREFGAIGNGISYAMGVAAAYPDEPIVMIDGDGGTLMHIQELETVKRHGMRILFIVLNDGAYGSEIHKLRSEGVDDGPAIFGRGDIGRIARGFDLIGHKVDDIRQLPDLFAEFQREKTAALWDITISANVVSPALPKHHKGLR